MASVHIHAVSSVASLARYSPMQCDGVATITNSAYLARTVSCGPLLQAAGGHREQDGQRASCAPRAASLGCAHCGGEEHAATGVDAGANTLQIMLL